jgi:hypothetical protein
LGTGIRKSTAIWWPCAEFSTELQTSGNDLQQPRAGEDFSDLRRAESTGRPVGAADFVSGLEKVLGRKIERRAPGRKVSKELVEANQRKLL